jgi:hypothetical protein
MAAAHHTAAGLDLWDRGEYKIALSAMHNIDGAVAYLHY